MEDLAGNVWGWRRTKWQESYQDYADDNDLEEYAPRVVRGGAFGNYVRNVRCAVRDWDIPSNRFVYIGFRVVGAAASPL